MKFLLALFSSLFLINVTFAQQPVITAFYPSNVLPGSTIEIYGSNFSQATIIDIGGQYIENFTIVSSELISAKIPLSTQLGSKNLTIYTKSGTATASKRLYINTPPPPTITSFSPLSVTKGSNITITGTNLSTTNSIGFGFGGIQDFIVNSETSITVKIPNNSQSGPIELITAGGYVASTNSLTITNEVVPSISSLTPTSGMPSTSFTITGSNFLSAVFVSINDIECQFKVNSSTSITATVPYGATSGKVQVVTSGGTVLSSGNFTVTPFPPPTITSFAPASGVMGSTITITGTNLSTAGLIMFNDYLTSDFVINSSTTITVKVPNSATSGKISIETAGGTVVSAANFTVTPSPAPTITSFTPSSGDPLSTLVTIQGSGFLSTSQVLINDIECYFVINSESSLGLMFPPEATTGKFTITTAGGTVVSPSFFTINKSSPSISSFTPATAFYNSSVTITGANFSTATDVYFGDGGNTGDFVINSPNSITAIVPINAAVGKIQVSTLMGIATSTGTFTPLWDNPATITSVSPMSGPIGSTITITGTNLSSTGYISFNGLITQDFIVNSATSLSVKVPQGASTGKIGLMNANYNHDYAESASDYVVTTQGAPMISSIAPASASIGSSITITGANLLATYYVSFNGVLTSDFVSNSATSITVKVPTGATTGKLTIATPVGKVTSTADLSITIPPAPIITSFSPATGSVGTSVTISGSNFAGATSVKFNNITSTSFTVLSSTSITAIVPDGATTGKISITNAGGTGTSSNNFTVTAPQVSNGVVVLVKDIATSFAYNDSDPDWFRTIGNKTFFVANDSRSYLWVTDGTESGTIKLSDVAEYPLPLGIFNGKFYFAAQDANGREIWSSDGTVAGTQLLKDINPGSGYSDPSGFVAAGSNFFFKAYDGSHGTEWWVTDGTSAGTHMTHDMEPSQGKDDGIFRQVVPFGNAIIFSRMAKATGRSDVWIVDGISTPVNLTQQFSAQYNIALNGGYMINYKGKVYFNFEEGNEGNELFVTDGTVSGTKMMNFVPGSNGFDVTNFCLFGDKFCFAAVENGIGYSQLYISDGTMPGTVNLGVYTTNLNYTIAGSILYFNGRDDNTTGNELYKTDGTLSGTSLVKDIKPGTGNGGPVNMAWCNGKLYFVADDGVNGNQPWVSDGTASGTYMLKMTYNGTNGSFANNFTALNGKVYFTARIAFNDFHLYESDGTTAGTKIIQPIDATNTSNPLGVNGSVITPPTSLKVDNGTIYLKANYGLGRELYRIGSIVSSIDQPVFETSTVLVYPNPVKDQLLITSKNNTVFNNDEVMIMDLTGKVLCRNNINGSTGAISTEQLSSGIYFVNINGSTFKIIKE